MNYEPGQTVEFIINSRGRKIPMRAEIALEVPAKVSPTDVPGYFELQQQCLEPGFCLKKRWHTTYLLRVRRGPYKRDRLYWPKVPNFKLVQDNENRDKKLR